MPYAEDSIPGVQMEETPQAIRAFNDYCALGVKRNLKLLLNHYLALEKLGRGRECPTLSHTTLVKWSREHHWMQRSADYERRIAEAAEADLVFDRVEWKKKRLEDCKKLQSAGLNLLQKFVDRIDELDEKSITTVAYLLPTAIRMIELAHKEEREEIGEEGDTGRVALDLVMDALSQALPKPIMEVVRVNLAHLISGASKPPPGVKPYETYADRMQVATASSALLHANGEEVALAPLPLPSSPLDAGSDADGEDFSDLLDAHGDNGY
jgi:hypothetical protein